MDPEMWMQQRLLSFLSPFEVTVKQATQCRQLRFLVKSEKKWIVLIAEQTRDM